MKPVLIYSNKILNALSWIFPIGGISLFPFIILRNEYEGTMYGEQVVRHETIHFKQAIETLVLGFYIIYVLNYFINIIVYRNLDKAYHNILFEREAYGNEKDKDYLKNRKLFAWIRK